VRLWSRDQPASGCIATVANDVHIALQQLEAAQQAAAESTAARQRADSLESRITQQTSELDAWRTTLAHEQHDVDRFNGMTLSRVIASLTGNRDQKLADESAERDAVALEVATRSAALDRVRAHVVVLRARSSAEPELSRKVEEARATYAKALQDAGDPRGNAAIQLIDRIGGLRAALSEVAEAQQACQSARAALRDAEVALSSAGSWSTYDTFFGGGMIADAIKRGRIGEASSAIERVQYALTVLAAEMKDVPGPAPAPSAPKVSATLASMDFWFDNIFSDWMVRERISASSDSVARTQERLAYVESSLAGDRQARMAELQQGADELAQLLNGRTS